MWQVGLKDVWLRDVWLRGTEALAWLAVPEGSMSSVCWRVRHWQMVGVIERLVRRRFLSL